MYSILWSVKSELYDMDVDASNSTEVAGAQSVERATALLMLVARFRRAGAGLGEIVRRAG